VREAHSKLDDRIAKIEKNLDSSEIVKGGGGDTVEVGSKVTVQRINTKDGSVQAEEKKYVIVGSEEADMANGKISNKSPFGQALFGKKKGEDISFKTPSGVVNYKIIDVS
jgi:transcription elongation factor GreA